MKTAVNLEQINRYTAEEAAVIRFLQCEIKNDQLMDGTYQENGVTFSLSVHQNRMDVTIQSPLAEVMQVSVQDGHIYDYDVLRDEVVE